MAQSSERAHQPFRTLGLVGKNAQHKHKVADACEEEKQDADSLRAFAAVIEQELGDARAEVESSAKVAGYLAPENEGDA